MIYKKKIIRKIYSASGGSVSFPKRPRFGSGGDLRSSYPFSVPQSIAGCCSFSIGVVCAYSINDCGRPVLATCFGLMPYLAGASLSEKSPWSILSKDPFDPEFVPDEAEQLIRDVSNCFSSALVFTVVVPLTVADSVRLCGFMSCCLPPFGIIVLTPGLAFLVCVGSFRWRLPWSIGGFWTCLSGLFNW